MPYRTFLILIGILLFISFLLLRLTKGKAKVFVKKTNWYVLGFGLFCALLGLTGRLVKEPASINVATLYALLQVAFLGLGIFHAWLFYKIAPWANRNGIKLELQFTIYLVLTCILFFFSVFATMEKGGFSKTVGGFGDNLALGLLLLPVPLIAVRAFEHWITIPRRKIRGWTPPIPQPPITIMPGNSIRLTMQMTYNFQSEDVVKIVTEAPKDRTLGEVFYFLLYRNNIMQRNPRKIEVAEDNSKDKVFQWLFFIHTKRWWWMSRKYLNPDMTIAMLDAQPNEIIFAVRLRHWN